MADIDPRFEHLLRFFQEGIPFNAYLGMQVEVLQRGYCVLRVPWRSELIGDSSRPAVHGGVTSALADTAGGLACFTTLDSPRDRVSTVDLRVDYLRPGPAVDLCCEARVVRVGNRVGVARMEVFAGEVPAAGSPERDGAIATAQGVYNILRRSGATQVLTRTAPPDEPE